MLNGPAVPIVGGVATVGNTSLVEAFGQDGNDTTRLMRRTARCQPSNCLGAPEMTRSPAVRATIYCSARPAIDILNGKGGADLLFGGDGNDVLTGGTGNDQDFVKPAMIA